VLNKDIISQDIVWNSNHTGDATIAGKTGSYTKEEIQDRINHFKNIPSIIGPALRSPMLGLQNVFLRKHSGVIKHIHQVISSGK